MSEQPDDGRMNIYLAVTITVLWYIGYPIAFVLYYAAHAIIFILRTLYRPVAFLLQPLIYLGRFILACLIVPFALLAKFEVSRRIARVLTHTDQATDAVHLPRHRRPRRNCDRLDPALPIRPAL